MNDIGINVGRLATRQKIGPLRGLAAPLKLGQEKRTAPDPGIALCAVQYQDPTSVLVSNKGGVTLYLGPPAAWGRADISNLIADRAMAQAEMAICRKRKRRFYQ